MCKQNKLVVSKNKLRNIKIIHSNKLRNLKCMLNKIKNSDNKSMF